MLDPPEAAPQHQRRNTDGGERHTHRTTHAKQFEPSGESCELGTCCAEVGQYQREKRSTAELHAVALPDQPDDPLTGDHTHPGSETMEQDQRDGGQRQHPQQLISVFSAEHRVGGDAGRVVVGETCDESGTDDREQGTDRQPPTTL